MKDLILHIYDWLSAHKRVAAALLIALVALSLASALRLDFQEDIAAFLPGEAPPDEGQDQMAVLFEGGSLQDRVDAMFAYEDVWNAAHPELPVYAEADQGRVLEVMDFLSANWPYFLEAADYRRMDSLLAQPGYLAGALAADKLSLYGGGDIQARYLRTDPLQLFSPVLLRLREASPESRLEEGCLFTPDGETGILLFSSPYGGSESAHNAALVQQVQAAKAAVAEQFPSVHMYSTGGPEVAAGNARRIKKDSILALAIAALLICVVLWFSYKRLADVLWILISIATGALIALGVIALFKSSISIIVLGIGCTIIGIAVNYPLHYVDHLKYQPDKRKALAEQVNPLLVGNITTVGAFLGLLLMKAEALHDFGFIGAMMLVGTIVFVLVFLPVFVPLAKGPRSAVKLDFDRHIRLSSKARKWTFVLFLALTAFLVRESTRVGFDANLHHINYMTADQEKGFAVLESLQQGSGTFTVPDESEQAERIGRWIAFLQEHPTLASDVQEAAEAEGFTEDAFAPFTAILWKDWSVQPRSYFAPADFAPQESFTARLVQNLSEDFDLIGLLCSLIVFLFLWISFGSLELSLLSFLPLAVSWYWIQGIMGLTGMQFNIVNIILATFIFGQGDDYTIFMTEGLMYERATGKKILHSYKNAVVLSALIMFIGIGALVVARHPAMRSLGQVTVIGMLTVVAMAYYLPLLVFRWLTTRKGQPRKAPLTLGRLLKTGYIYVVFLISMLCLSAWAFLYFLIGKDSERKRLRFHKVIQRTVRAALRLIPGARYTLNNASGEDFSRPAVYVCNHQSHFDVLALLALQPKLIFTTNDWVWNFPLYGYLLRKAEFYPASKGHAANSGYVKELVARGYSIAVFPEGTRSEDCHIQRFHRGAFLTAQELGLDILPLCIHGFGYALPKHDFMLRKAGLYMEIGERIPVPSTADIAAFTREVRHHYQAWYAQIRERRETAAYCAPWVRLQYLYKGHDARKEVRQVLRKAHYARIDALQGPEIVIRNAGCGVEALLTALAHPFARVTAYEADEEKFLTATRCELPPNLTYKHE